MFDSRGMLGLRHLRNQEPAHVGAIHRHLADYYNNRFRQSELPLWKLYESNSLTLRYDIECSYHRTASDPDIAAICAAELYLEALRWNSHHAYNIARSAHHAIAEADLAVLPAGPVLAIAESYARRDKPGVKEAITSLDLLTISDPARSDLLWLHWWISDNEQEESDFVERAIALDESNHRMLAARGREAHIAGRYDEAVADLTKAIELDPNYESAWASRGGVHSRAGRHDEAVADLTKAIDLDEDYRWAQIQMAHAGWALGDTAMADDVLQRLDGLGIEAPDHAGIVAYWHFAHGNYERAYSVAESGVHLPIVDGWDRFGVSLAHYVLGDEAEAKGALQRAVKAIPDLLLIGRTSQLDGLFQLYADASDTES